ncbi:MAG: hypothetical protein ACYTEQ_26480, partial [Planctomycetota bacterium]
MPIVRANHLGQIGLITDQAAAALPPEAFSNAVNVRFEEGHVERFAGESAAFGTPTIGPHWLLPWEYSGNLYWIYCNGTYAYRTDGTAHVNVTRYTATPGDDDYTAGSNPDWNGDVLGTIPIINNGTDVPQQWSFVNTRFEDLSNWPAANMQAKVIRAFKNFLIGLYITDAGTVYPTKLKWSTPADPGAVPASWDHTDATLLAGEQNFSDTAGDLVDCLSMGDVNVIYKTDATWMMQLVGGQFIFRTSKILRRHGMLAQGCAVEVDRKHLVLSVGDVIVHDGHQVDSIISRKNRKLLFNTIDNEYAYKARALPNYSRNEVWFCIPTGGSGGRLTKAFVYNYRESTWTTRDLDDITDGGSGLSVGESDYTFDGDTPGSFDAAVGAFGITGSYKASERLLLCRPDATAAIYLTDSSSYQFNASNFAATVERENIPLVAQDRMGNPIVDVDTVKFLRAVHPRVISASGATIQVQIGTQMSLDEPITWATAKNFVVGTDTKIDCTLS